MVSEERRQLVDVRVRVGVPVVAAEEVRELAGRLRPRREVLRRELEREVEHALDVVLRREVRRVGLRLVEDLAECIELVLADGPRGRLDRGREAPPERVVDVLHRVDPEAVDPEVADPGAVDVDHPVDDARLLGEQVVEPEEVAVERVLAGERRVAAVVVGGDVVQPRRHLVVLAAGRGGVRRVDRLVREAHVGRERRESARPRVVAVVERAAGRGAIRRLVLGLVARRRTLRVRDDVRRVVGDDVEVDLHPARVGGVDERAQVVVGPEMRVDLREVGDPVAVVARGRKARVVLHGLVLEARGQPDGRRPEILDVVDAARQALEVAAVIPALAGGIEAGRSLDLAGRQAAVVVGRVAVVEAVGHDEVEVLAGDGRAQAVAAVGLVGRAGWRRRRADRPGRGRGRGRGRRRDARPRAHGELLRPAACRGRAGAANAGAEDVAAGGDGARDADEQRERPRPGHPRPPDVRPAEMAHEASRAGSRSGAG